MDTPEMNAGANGGAGAETGASGIPLSAEDQAALDAAKLADDEAKAKAEAEALEAKRLQDEADAKAEADRVAALNAKDEERPSLPLRKDGPTLKEWLAHGYREADYPPTGYAAVTDETKEKSPLDRLDDLEARVKIIENKIKHTF